MAVRLLPGPTIVVEDTGPGIRARRSAAASCSASIGATTPTSEGTGLGLAIVHEVALAHSGRFVIGEAAGGGARFEMHFPAA